MQILQIGNPKESEGVSELQEEAGRDWKWIVIAVIVIIVIAAISGGGDDKDKNPQKVSQTPSDDKQTSSENKKTDDTETQDKSNVFQVGDVVETEDFKITFVSAGKYKSDNEYITPKKGTNTGSSSLSLKIHRIPIRMCRHDGLGMLCRQQQGRPAVDRG